ncbi:RS10B protein, partial [Pachycephala philippinensis]|nr:RS10B protein [Pachycephala philippinensis]
PTPGESKNDVSLLDEDVKEEQDSCPEKELTDEAIEDKDDDELLSLWKSKVQIFFTTKFFPAFEHEIVLREKRKENKKQDAELAGLRKIQAEELARRIAEKEVEARRQEAAAAEKALAELEESAKTSKGKPKKGALSKKDASGRGVSPKRSVLANKEAAKRESSPEKSPQGSRA